MNGPVGLDYPAVFQVAQVYGIRMNRAVFEKIRALENRGLGRVYKTRK